MSDGQIAAEALERLDFFTAELKKQGLYFSFGLHAVGGYAGLDSEALARFPRGQVVDRFHASFLAAEQTFARALLNHENPQTQKQYSQEPALLYVELNDEDTLFPSSAGSPDDLPENYRKELAQGYAAWIRERTADGLRAPGPAEQEARGELPTFHDSASVRADYAQYLRTVEVEHVRTLATFVRKDLNLRAMLINSQVSFGGLAGVLREAEISDFIDIHGTWAGPQASGTTLARLGSLQDTSQVSAADAGVLGLMAGYRVFGKPFVVSAYAMPAPSDYAAEMLPLLIGIAGLQDWDAVFAFAYADQKRDYEPARINGVFDLAGHPAKLAFLTTAASAFRRGVVAPAQNRVELRVPNQPNALPFAENALTALWREGGVPASLAAVHQLGIVPSAGTGEVSASAGVPSSGTVGSDTGELVWESQGPHAHFSIDAPALKAVCGRLASSVLKFAGVDFEFEDFSPDFACASLLSLDDQPIASARRLLLTVVGRVQNAQQPAAAPSASPAALGAGPVLAQYVPITVTLPRAAWHAAALDAAGKPVHPLPVEQGRASRISAQFQGATLSYAISR
jgi:hypothetical protein